MLSKTKDKIDKILRSMSVCLHWQEGSKKHRGVSILNGGGPEEEPCVQPSHSCRGGSLWSVWAWAGTSAETGESANGCQEPVALPWLAGILKKEEDHVGDTGEHQDALCGHV